MELSSVEILTLDLDCGFDLRVLNICWYNPMKGYQWWMLLGLETNAWELGKKNYPDTFTLFGFVFTINKDRVEK